MAEYVKWIEQAKRNKEREMEQCTAHKPLLIIIPPEGTIIPCPVHLKGHFFFPNSPVVTY